MIPFTSTPHSTAPVVIQSIFDELKTKLHSEQIRQCAARNGERPFGYVLDYIKDMYGLTKSEAWDTAQAVCRFFKV